MGAKPGGLNKVIVGNVKMGNFEKFHCSKKSIFFNYLYQGVPTHDQAGEPLSDKQIKKLKKLYQQQEKLYNSLSASVASQATNDSEE